MNNRGTHEQTTANRKLVRKLILVSVAMFGFGFAMWPLYNVFCDLTGLGGRGVKIAQTGDGVVESMEKIDRQVKVRFDSTVNSGLPWIFEAKEHTARVQLGQLSEALYLAMNPNDEAIVGQAIYNVTPPEASLYFVKTECFCFTQQLLQAHESKEMPVYFFIRPDLPDHIKELTLSYTFYRAEDVDTLTLVNASEDSKQ